MLSIFGSDMSPENFDNILDNFEAVDQSCRAALEHCTHPLSVNAINELSHHLQNALEKLRPTSLTIEFIV